MKPEMITPNTIAEPSTTRPGLNITLTAKVPVCVSQVWGCGDWQVQFVRLGALESVPLDQSAGEVYVKVVSGGLASPRSRLTPQTERFGAPGLRIIRCALVTLVR